MAKGIGNGFPLAAVVTTPGKTLLQVISRFLPTHSIWLSIIYPIPEILVRL